MDTPNVVCFGEIKVFIASILNLSEQHPKNKIVRIMSCKY